MKRSYKKCITLLDKLDAIWDSDLYLFGNSGTLFLVEAGTHKVIKQFSKIEGDGGDCGTRIGEDEEEYLDLI